MTMIKGHFEMIASTLKERRRVNVDTNNTKGLLQVEGLAFDFARKLASTNPTFNRDRFLRACGVE